MKKIFLISPIIDNLILFRKELILVLVERGYDITLLCSFQQESLELSKLGVHFVNVDIDRRGTNILSELKLLKTYYHILKIDKPDVVLTYTSKCSVYAGMVCRLLKIPYIVNNSGLFDPRRIGKLFGVFLNFLHRLGYSGTACMMYQNPSEMEFFKKIFWKKVPYRLLPGSGVNLEKFRVQPFPTGKQVNFLMICRIQKEKGIEEYMQAASMLKQKYPFVNFMVLGGFDEDYHTQINQLVNEGVLLYYEPVKDVRPYINNAHCIVNPSYHEGMSNVLLEASASGRPTIASDCPGCNNITNHEVNGFLAKIGDAEDLAAQMEKFILLPSEERMKMGLAGRKIVEDLFDRQIVINAYIEEINKICPKI